jgi:hypothetical protein
MAAVHAIAQARDYLSYCSRGDDSRTIPIISSLSHNRVYAQTLERIQSKKSPSTSYDQPDLYLDAFVGHKRDQPTDAVSSPRQVFPGSVHLCFPEFLLL